MTSYFINVIILGPTLVAQVIQTSFAQLTVLGCEDIRPLFEKLNEFAFDLPVDLAIRPFDQSKEAFG